ncbi:relaxase/mobilization nuclease domain-containing protein [Enterococcus sp. AZ163]|uniref:relaxase/mobilization nuclease domain-containing protein n=1 Tax=Enterococcus sp. AZ163 TaxID=2774638 RepID=UPI003D292270
MAVTTIHQIKSTLKKAIDYIQNPEKTDEGLLVSSYNCEAQLAEVEMEITRQYAREVKGDYRKTGGSEVLAHHLIQSFSPEDDVSPELAHEIGKQLVDELLGGKFEYVISTHVDKDHIHNHIIFNSVSFYDLKKFRSQPYRTANQILEISNRLCAENDLSIAPRKQQLRNSYKNYSKYKKNSTFRAEIRKRLNMILDESVSIEEFKTKAAELKIDVDDSGKHITYFLAGEGQQRKTRGNKLDDLETYTLGGIQERVETNKILVTQLEKAIEESFSTSDNLEDFQFNLRQDHGITFKEHKRFGIVFQFDDVERSSLKERILPDSYHIENLNGNFRTDYDFSQENSLEPISERYRQQEKSKIENQETPIVLLDEQIEKVTKEGLLINLKSADADGYIFINSNFVDVDKVTGDYTIWIGDKFDYTVRDQSGEVAENYTLKGEGVIRGLELAKGIEPMPIYVHSKYIKSISERGLSLSMPDKGIERLFIPKEYVEYDQISKNCTVRIGENWNYYGKPTLPENATQEQIRNNAAVRFKGQDVISELQKESKYLDVLIQPKMNMLRHRMQKMHTSALVETLNTFREEKIEKPSDLAQKLAAVHREKSAAQTKIDEIEKKITNYNNVAKLLVTYEKYLPIVKEIDGAGFLQKTKLEKQYESELRQFNLAEKKLTATNNLRTDMPKEKIIALAKNQEQQKKRLIDSFKYYEQQLEKLEDARLVLEEVTGDQLEAAAYEYSEIESLGDRLDELENEAKQENDEREVQEKRNDRER